jgi:HEAT repeat protein
VGWILMPEVIKNRKINLQVSISEFTDFHNNAIGILMVLSELALGYITNLLYDSSRKVPEKILDSDSKIYEKALNKFSVNDCKVDSIQIDTFFHQKNVEVAIKKDLKNPDKSNCLKILVDEFFELFDKESFSREDVDLIFNTFFEAIDSEIEKDPELRSYLQLYLTKQIHQKEKETNEVVHEIHQDVKDLYKVIIDGSVESRNKGSNADFEKAIKEYIHKIIAEDKEIGISEVYTELSAKEILPITLKFRDETDNKQQEFEVLELVKKEEKLIISGESGSGKTTTLKWLNYIFAANYLEKREEITPLYIELNSYTKGSFDDYIRIRAKGKGISEDNLKVLLKGKAIILLDGLDLLSPTNEFFPYEEVSNFVSEYSNCRYVISSRPGFFESIKSDFKVSELEKLTDEKILIFIDKNIPNKKIGDIIKYKILKDYHLKSLLTNPMLLYLTIKSIERKGSMDDSFPSNRSEMYEDFVSGLFAHYRERTGKTLHTDRIQIENTLIDLYFELQCKNEVSCKYREALKAVKKGVGENAYKEVFYQNVFDDCFKLGLLKQKDSKIEYGIHQSFQEYFAAIKLKELFERGFDISNAFSHPKWEEVLIFTSEMLDSVDKFVNLMVSKGELFLASKCVNKAKDETKENLCSLISTRIDSKYELEKINYIKSLGRIGTAATNIIAIAVRDKDYLVWKNAVNILGDLKTDVSIKILSNILMDKNEDKYVRMEVATTLGKIKAEATVDSLISVLRNKNEDVDVRGYVAESLGNIVTEKSMRLLISILKDKNEESYVREKAVSALGRTISEETVLLLTSILKNKDEDKEVRKRVIYCLIDMQPENAEQLLISILKDKNEGEDVRNSTKYSLADIRSKAALESLISIIKDINEDKYGRESAVYILGKTKAEEAVKTFISMLMDKNEEKDLRGLVARALGEMKAETAVQFLVNILNDKDEVEEVKRGAVSALGDIKSDEAIESLIDALKNKDHIVRANAAYALKEIRTELAVEPFICQLKDLNKDVRGHAALVLGMLKAKKAIEPLISLLGDKTEEPEVKNYAMYALGEIKAEDAVEPLISLLNNNDKDLQQSAAFALGEIKAQAAIEPLICLLNNEDKDLQLSAAYALKKSITSKNIKQLESLLEFDNEFSNNVAFEILYEFEKQEKSKMILVEAGEKFLKI